MIPKCCWIQNVENRRLNGKIFNIYIILFLCKMCSKNAIPLHCSEIDFSWSNTWNRSTRIIFFLWFLHNLISSRLLLECGVILLWYEECPKFTGLHGASGNVTTMPLTGQFRKHFRRGSTVDEWNCLKMPNVLNISYSYAVRPCLYFVCISVLYYTYKCVLAYRNQEFVILSSERFG